MNYKSYETVKTMPKRRARKGTRNTTFITNMTMRQKLNREKRAAREESK